MKIDRSTIIKDIIGKHPETFAVFKKHRLVLAGGVRGPNEPLAFFCKAHGVDFDAIVKELEEVIAEGPKEGTLLPPLVEDTIYTRYVKTALVLSLTVGCTFGAGLLSYIALKFDYSVPPVAYVQAHAHAQLFGWIGLFIMGFAYYIVPRVKNVDLHGRGLTYLSFWTMLVGVALRTVLQTLPNPSLGFLLPLSGVLQLSGAGIFSYVIFRTTRASQEPRELFDKFFLAGLTWFVFASGLNLFIDGHLYRYSTLEIPSSLQQNLNQLFLFGFVFMFIFAVNLRTVYAFLDVLPPRATAANVAFWLLNACLLLYFVEYLHSWLVYPLAAAVFLFVYGVRVFERPTKELSDVSMDRSYEKTIRAAYLWLIIGMLVRLAVPSLGDYSPIGHIFHGASNHALTVGFITMMMIGYASKMVPTFRGVNLYSLRLSELTFVFLNLGIFLRVFGQILIPYNAGIFYPVVGASGWVEVSALSFFAYNIWMTMNLKEELVKEKEMKKIEKITKETIVYDIVEQYPDTLKVFVDFGFKQLENPVARKTMAKMVSVEMACQLKSIDQEKLLKALNACLLGKQTT
ncbi:MAG: DUF1858 domain-containing protein [Candidatus Brocadiales bacterium]|nr:DUF1858 domain-containing protein [Candidatus Brocadiales bacterium]